MVIYIFVFIFGSIIGSFLNVCIYRLPKGLSLVKPASHCPSCQHPVMFYDNIPVISYFILGGKCRYCKSPFSFRYPFIEALNGFLYVLIVARFGLIWLDAFYFVFISTMVVIFFIDLDYQIIPDKITLPGIPLSFIAGAFFLPDPFLRKAELGWKNSLIGLLSGFLLFLLIAELARLILKKDAMGGGDIKFMTMLGAVLGWKGVLLTTFLSSFLGSFVGISMAFLQKQAGPKKIPFGPFIAVGASICLFYGQEILEFYVKLMYGNSSV